jgi:hypothetical protein
MRVVWFSGIRLKALNELYGGSTRSLYMMKTISEVLGADQVFLMVYGGVSGEHAGDIVGDDVRVCYARMAPSSILLRGLLRPFFSTSWGRRSPLRLLTVRAARGSLLRCIEEVELGDEDVVVFDGLRGFLMAEPVLEAVRRRNVRGLIYLSHNFEADYYSGFGVSRLLDAERRAVRESDVTIFASFRDRERYLNSLEVKPERGLVFPNIFPVPFSKGRKYDELTMAVIAGSTYRYASRIAAFALSRRLVDRILYVGRFDPAVLGRFQGSEKLVHRRAIMDRGEFLGFISMGHLGVNYGLWLGGSNVKKYDYALAGLTVFSSGTGYRDVPLPGEIAFTDFYDFAAKIRYYNVDTFIELGVENERVVLRVHREAMERLREVLSSL